MGSWDFRGADTRYLTHGLHEYPARMVPQIARRLIETYTCEGDLILDPFCGSGTTLVEARLTGRSAIGVDVNPLAVLIARVKATPIDFDDLGFNAVEFLSEIEEEFTEAQEAGELPKPPLQIHRNLLHWFREDVACELEFLYRQIKRVKLQVLREFLMVVLSDTVFKCSNIDRRSSRFIRTIRGDELKRFKPDVLGSFRVKLLDSVGRISEFTGLSGKVEGSYSKLRVEVLKGDVRNLRFREESFDAVITSPPYGEEKNTVGYERWSKLSAAWLRLDHDRLSDGRPLGSGQIEDMFRGVKELPALSARMLLTGLMVEDDCRVRDALPFFFDYLAALKQMFRVLKLRGYCCIVVGDRSIRRRPLDMERVTVELGEAAGFKHVKSYFREIPVKLIPWSTPTGRTISKESIIVLQR